AVREVTHLLNDVVEVVTELRQDRAGLALAAPAEALGSAAEFDLQRRQTRLHPVVKILGDTLALRIPRRHHLACRPPSPRGHKQPDAKAAAFALRIDRAEA